MTFSTLSPQPPTAGAGPARQAPGRPEQTAERLPVPGRPQAEPLRPAHSPGRIPIAEESATAGEAQLSMLERVDAQVNASLEIQLLRASQSENRTSAAAVAPQTPAPPDEPGEWVNEPYQTVHTEMHLEISIEIEISVQFEMSMAFRRSMQATPKQEPPPQSDPLALDLDGNGLQTTGIEQGVIFDIDADGRADQVSFVRGGDAFLALDRNNNGRIDNGRELFGDQHGDKNGYEALAHHDDNHDGRIDQLDQVFNRLRLFSIDAQGQHRQIGLSEAGIRAINLAYQDVHQGLNASDTLAQISSFEWNSGEQGQSGDLLLGFKARA